MKSYLEILRHCPLFFEIKDEDLSRMLLCLGAKIEHFDKKQTIFWEGSPARYLGIMLSGSAQIIHLDYFGNRSILRTVHAFEVFGEAFACAAVDALPVSIVASEPCDVMLIDSDHVLHTCEKHCAFHRQLIFNLMKDLATKTISFHQKIEVVAQRTTREKLMTYLLLYAKKAGSNSFDIPFNRQELADYLEVERSGLSAEIGKLRREGVLESNRRHFTLL